MRQCVASRFAKEREMSPVAVFIIVMECGRETQRDPLSFCPSLCGTGDHLKNTLCSAQLLSAGAVFICHRAIILQQSLRCHGEVVWTSPHFLPGFNTCICLQNILEQRTHGDDCSLVTAINYCHFGLYSGLWVSVKTGLFFRQSECSGLPNTASSSLPMASGYVGAFGR